MVFNKLAEFEENSLKISKKYIQVNGETVSAVDQILKETINDIQHNISKWHYQIESNKKVQSSCVLMKNIWWSWCLVL